MPAPLVAVAGVAVKRALWRRVVRVSAALAPVLLVGAIGVGLVLDLAVSSGNDTTNVLGPDTCTTLAGQASGHAVVDGLDAAQLANAQTIVAVGRRLGVPAYGWVIALATALQESGLRNLAGGDRDSVGLFQQRSGWGPVSDRLDPVTAATMFFTGGRGGQPGLQQLQGWMAMPVTAAAQAVQESAFPKAYAGQETRARQLVADPTILSATCLTSVAFSGDGTVGARAVADALRWVGVPYSWGGGSIYGPTLGFAEGAGTVGFDCSSLTQYAWFQAAGIRLPRVTTDQADALPHVPLGAPLQAGDLLFFHDPADPPGVYHHVGIYDGQGDMVHAPHTGAVIEVVHDVLSIPYYRDQLAVVARPGGISSTSPGAAAARSR